jgi:parvulin-like peptidyl-prolyl isomerase
MKKIIIFHTVLFGLLFGVGVYGYVKYWNVATVNGRPISRLAYIKAMEKQVGKQILGQMVDDSLILNEGANKNVKIDQKTIDDEISKIEEKLKAQNQTLDAALVANNMTKADLENQIRLKKIQDILSAPKTEVTQAQVDEFLKANKALLPAGKSKDELNTLAKNQLTLEASQAAATEWLSALKASAKVIYQ